MTASSSNSTDKLVASFIRSNGSKYDAKKLSSSTQTETVSIDENNQVIISQGVVYVQGCNTVAPTSDRLAKGAVDVSQTASLSAIATTSSSGTTPIVSYYYAAYGAVAGQELWRVIQEAQFTYTGSSVTVNYSNGYYTRGVLSVWQVSNWANSQVSSIFENNIWTKRVMSSGNFHFGFEIQGVGIVIQDKYVWIDARCTVDGQTNGFYNVT